MKKISVALFLVVGILIPPFSFQGKEAMAAGVNLIKNPSVETGTTLPDFWSKGGWGTNTATFTYPIAGINSMRAMRVDMTAFTSGDAKWVFADVPVKPGTKYVFSDSYLSNVATEADIQYTTTSGATSFILLGTFPASTATATKQFTFTTPANVSAITIFHLIDKVGYLVTDNYSLAEEGAVGTDTAPPTASITSPSVGAALSATTTVSVNATDNISVAGVTLLVDGATVGTEDIAAPYDFLWNTKSVSDGSHTLTAKARDTSNNIATSAPITVTTANSTPPATDTAPPSVHLILPEAGTAVASTTPLSFGATDNVGVSGVTLLVDGAAVGAEDTVAPYDFLWNTTSFQNGPHMIFASARDAAGNIGTSTPAELTVNNVVLPPNLIANPLFESAGANGDPENWFRGSWGTSTVAFTYPTVGSDGGKAAKIDMTNYASGDAKWYFADVPVTAGKTYSFTDSYKSTAPTDLVAQYKTSGGIFYQFIASVPISSVWKTETFNLTAPTGATAVSVFHSIGSNGSLEVDNYALILGATPSPASDVFPRGLVSFTFDDGWITQYNDAFPILNAAGLKGTFYIVSQETLNAVPTEQITNQLLETAGGNGDPEKWFRGGWGTNTAAFTYPIVGIDGGKAAKIDMTNYTDGDAKWYFMEAKVSPNEDYVLTDSYQSNTASVMTIRYTFLDNTVQYADIAVIPSSGGAWKTFTQTITIPANADTITAFHLLRGNGSLAVDNYSLKMIPIYINPTQLLQFQSAGHEIGGHTQTHISLLTASSTLANAEIIGSRNDLFGMGVTSLTTMAYPYGDYNTTVETMTKNAGFSAARSVDRGFNTKSTDKYALKIQQMDRTTTMTNVQTWVAQAAADKTWLILMFHQEDNNPAHDLGVTPAFLQQAADYIKTANVSAVTVSEGVAQMNP